MTHSGVLADGPAVTVLLPTHERPRTLRLAVACVQQQTVQDFELFIVGDGVADATRAVVAELSAADARVRFFDFSKGPGQGEINRHRALQHARGHFVAYLGDDDWWMPNHLEVLGALLTDADFGHTLQVGVNSAAEIVVIPADLQNPAFRARMLSEVFNRFDFTFAGHTTEAYHRLPHGWRTTPPEVPWTDLYMWRQFLAEPWCRARSAMIPTGINTWSHQRPHLTDEERANDLAHWRAQAADTAFQESLWRRIADCFATESVGFELEAIRHATGLGLLEAANATAQDDLARTQRALIGSQSELARLQTEQSQSQSELARLQTEQSQSQSELARLQSEQTQSQSALARARAESAQAYRDIEPVEAERVALTAALVAVRNSTSWRLTRPLRELRMMADRIMGQRP